MLIPSNELACRTLFYHAASDGRAQALFGPYWEKTCDAVLPYTQGVAFPNLYLEFPLKGDPFLDVTALIHTVEPGGPSCPEAVAGFAPVYNWVTKLHEADRRICFGFELDAATAASGPAAVHFQHYEKLHLAEEFCKRMGDPDTGKLYLDLAERMPAEWRPSFFGMFRGRAGSSLRVCGYLSRKEIARCAENPAYLETVFSRIGFTAYDEEMLRAVSAWFSTVRAADYQIDVRPDGTLGEVFAVDGSTGVLREQEIKASFDSGSFARMMTLLESWGSADSRWRLAAGMTLTRGFPAEDENGNSCLFAMLVRPDWVKARWRAAVLQNAKCYCRAWAGVQQEKVR
jgi:hypothetical protein